MQISVELIDTYDQTQLWGEQYNRPSRDLEAIQAEISQEIADRLRVRISGSEQKGLAGPVPKTSDAYILLLKGRFYWHKSTTEAGKKALEYCKQAIAVDPGYALAYADLAHFYNSLGAVCILNPKDAESKADVAAKRALQLDASLAEPHVELARIRLDQWQWSEAERGFRRALELKPSYARAYNWYSRYLSVVGRDEEAIVEINRARDLDPLSLSYNANVGSILKHAGLYDEAIEALNETLELDKNFAYTHLYFGYVYAAKGMYLKAIDGYRRAIELYGRNTSFLISLGYALARSGQTEQAESIRSEVETTTEYVSPADLAILYAGLGDKEEALRALERAYAAHDPQLQNLPRDPSYDSLRSDARFADLVRKIGLSHVPPPRSHVA